MNKKRKYWLENYGCQMNKAEASAIELELQDNGWIRAESDLEADLAIINTCSVRKTAENRIWGRIGHYKHLKKSRNIKLAVIGCMAENWKEKLKKEAPVVDIVAGTKGQKLFVKKIIGEYEGQGDFLEEDCYSFHHSHNSENSISALVPIMHGCNNFCSYCIVPYVRGREVSRDSAEILEEVEKLALSGVKDITLLGQNVNSYNDSKKEINFASLLKLIAENTNIPRIRFMSSHPKDLSDDIIEIMASKENICNHLHLPVQHGSTKILKEMNRKYSKEDYMNLVEKLKKKIPGISLTTDIMVGFPGETESDLNELKDLLKEIRFSEAFTYFYNSREGTKAYGRTDSLSEELKKSRLAEIIKVQREITSEVFRNRVGSTVSVIVESISKRSDEHLLGKTDRNENVLFTGSKDMIGEILSVEIIDAKGQTLYGKEVLCPGE